MPKKLQIKLLSQTAELLTVTNCAAGMVSVLRSESPSELRPYQRALGGTPGKERFVIQVDGAEYRPDDHTLIGFGGAPPHLGLTVLEYLAKTGMTEAAIHSMLLSKGLDTTASKQCSSLSADEDRRIRIIAATMDPERAIILNEPFEPIASQWREDTAELLIDFVKSKSGLVVVAGLSYRPDAWVENPSVARHQVGQSLRRTVGFGAAGSESMELINQLRDQVRSESSESAPLTPQPPKTSERVAMGASLATAALGAMGAASSGSPGETGLSSRSTGIATTGGRPALFAKISAGIIGVGGGVYGALLITSHLHQATPATAPTPAPTQVIVAPEQQVSNAQQGDQKENVRAAIINRQPPTDAVKTVYILDRYPDTIRASLIETSRGVLGEVAPQTQEPQPQRSHGTTPGSGNLFKLLENASADRSEGPNRESGWQPQQPPADEPAEIEQDLGSNGNSEEERREAIRQKFLEAIQAAAEHHQG